MKKTMLSAMVSLLAASVLLGGCTADAGGESESDGAAAEGSNVGGGEEVGEAQQALVNSHFWGVNSNGVAGGWACDNVNPNTFYDVELSKWNGSSYQYLGKGRADAYNGGIAVACGNSPYHMYSIYVGVWNGGPGQYMIYGSVPNDASKTFFKFITR